MPDAIHPPPAGAPSLSLPSMYGYLFDALPVNALHSVLRMILGALGLALAGNGFAVRMYSRGVALLYATFALCGCLPVLNTLFGFIPLFGDDVALHASIAVMEGYSGWAPNAVPEVANRPGMRWLARAVAKVIGLGVLWFVFMYFSLFHEITWWYDGPVRPTGPLMRQWIARELPRHATKAQTLAFLRSHFIGPNDGPDQYLEVDADQIYAQVYFVRYVPGCSMQLNLTFNFDRTGRLSTHNVEELPICL